MGKFLLPRRSCLVESPEEAEPRRADRGKATYRVEP